MLFKVVPIAAIGLALAFSAYAQTPDPAPTAPVYQNVPGPTLDQSLTLARAALDACHARGFDASASVVDSAGRVKVTLRADNAPKPPVAAPLKAATAAAFDAAGSDLSARMANDSVLAAKLADKTLYNPHPGSLPLHQGGKLIGGMAVADVPHDVADACARAAVAASPFTPQ